MTQNSIFRYGAIVSVLLAGAGAIPFVASAVAPNCTVGASGDYQTIQAAVNDAACTTITVDPGTYAEHVTLSRAVTLKGANAGVAGNGVRGAESIITGTTTGALQITANDVTVDGFKIMSASNALGAGIHMAMTQAGAMIENNVITGNQIGVYANSAGTTTISHNLFDANNQDGSAGGTGIYSESTKDLTIDGNVFTNHTVNNPVLFATTAETSPSHSNLVFTNNVMHDNAFSNVYAIGVAGGTFTGNTITPASDASGLSFVGADTNISVMNNVISGGGRGVRVDDGGFGFGTSTNITVNRNNLSADTEFGVGNLGGYAGDVNGTCNWWGSASGPGPVGPGTGSPVTTGVDFANWLTTSDLSGDCNGPLPPPPTMLKVHILKYLDGATSTAVTANNYQFPITATSSSNHATSTTSTFMLGNNSGGATDQYGADTAALTAPVDYALAEVTSDMATSSSVLPIGADCAEGMYRLQGYKSSGVGFADAANQSLATSSPSFTGLTGDEYVIVLNEKCAAPPPPPQDKMTGAIRGIKQEDTDARGHHPRIAGVTFYLDTNNNGVLDSGEASTTTGVNGVFNFTHLAAGTYHVRELVPAGWFQSRPASGVYDVTLAEGERLVNNHDRLVFSDYQLGGIAGEKCGITTNRTIRSCDGQTGLSGWVIELHKIAATSTPVTAANVIATTTTDGGGNFSFANLVPGWYAVTEVQQAGWTQVHKPGIIRLDSGEAVTGVNLINRGPKQP